VLVNRLLAAAARARKRARFGFDEGRRTDLAGPVRRPGELQGEQLLSLIGKFVFVSFLLPAQAASSGGPFALGHGKPI
jgi:hypothetical protein